MPVLNTIVQDWLWQMFTRRNLRIVAYSESERTMAYIEDHNETKRRMHRAAKRYKVTILISSILS